MPLSSYCDAVSKDKDQKTVELAEFILLHSVRKKKKKKVCL